jgi:nitrous oxidase accessory protein
MFAGGVATAAPAGSLRESIASAQEGETILVTGPHIQIGPVVVEKRIRLIGTNGAVVDGGGKGTTLLIKAAGVEVTGLTIRNSGSDLGRFDSAIRIEADAAVIRRCRLENDGFGVYIRGAGGCRILDNEIADSGKGGSVRGNGIHLWKTARNEILNNQITGKRDGIYLSYADRNRIAANGVRLSRFGIHYMYSHHNQLLDNTLSSNTVGATLMFARHCLVEGNRVIANRRHGLLLKQLENSRVSGNRVFGHNRGLFVQQAVQDRFEDNEIVGNDIGLYLSSGSEQNVFLGNSFIDNTDQVWQPPHERENARASGNAFFEKGRGNFWSDYTGTDRNQDGLGDTPYHETDVYGYILDRHAQARIFALSPAVGLLRKGEELLPLLDLAGVTDLFPLTQPRSRPADHQAASIPKP